VQNVPAKPTHRAVEISNQTRSDFKYLTDFGKSVKFRIGHIPINLLHSCEQMQDMRIIL